MCKKLLPKYEARLLEECGYEAPTHDAHGKLVRPPFNAVADAQQQEDAAAVAQSQGRANVRQHAVGTQDEQPQVRLQMDGRRLAAAPPHG